MNITGVNLYKQTIIHQPKTSGISADTVERKIMPAAERNYSESGINIKISDTAKLVNDELEQFHDKFNELADKLSQNKNNTESVKSSLLKMLEAAEAQKSAFALTLEQFREQQEMHDKAMEAMAKEMEKQRKAMIIAMRIAAGDNVPVQDKEFLLEQAPGMYMKAHLMRMHRDNPRDYDSILTDEDRQSAEHGESVGSTPGTAAISSAGGSSDAVSVAVSGVSSSAESGE